MLAYQDLFFPETKSKDPEEDWAKYLCEESIEELMREDVKKEEIAKNCSDQVIESTIWGLVTELPICIPLPRESVISDVESLKESSTVCPVVESESTVVGHTVDVTPSFINKMNDSSAYSSVSNDRESIDLSKDLPH